MSGTYLTCQKCRGRMIGPTYGRDGWGGEHLRYRCSRCGYTCTMPTADAPPVGPLNRGAHHD